MRIVAPISKNPASKAKFVKNLTFFYAAILHPLWAKVFKSETTTLSFPQGFRKSKKLGHWTLGNGAIRRLKEVNKGEKKVCKKLFRRGNFRPFLSKNVHIWHHFFPLIFPKDSKSLQILNIQFWKVGAKRRLNGTSKVNILKKIVNNFFSLLWF